MRARYDVMGIKGGAPVMKRVRGMVARSVYQSWGIERLVTDIPSSLDASR